MAASGQTPRRGVAVKRADGEPLTRVDIQYDFLRAIFDDSHEVFTDPYASKDILPTKVSFRDLYIKAILHSPKATKALKDKMNEVSLFAEDFAILSLLVNVGRVNTTMSFFPEMKTAIRTYHPIPSLQRTNGNMQDAPRIKHILKTSLLEDEIKTPPATPADILARCKLGSPPSTSVTNLIFVLAHHSGPVGQSHFEGRLEFIDLFIRTELSSASRAQAFLWLCYYYLDKMPANPFSDPGQLSLPPPLTSLTYDQAALENQESSEDVSVTAKLIAQRHRIVESHIAKDAGKLSAKVSVNGSVAGDEEGSVNGVLEDAKLKPKRSAPVFRSKTGAKRNAAGEKKMVTRSEKPEEQEFTSIIPGLDDDDNVIQAFLTQRSTSLPKLSAHDRFGDSLDLFSSRIKSHPTLRNSLGADRVYITPHRYRYSPYGQNHSQTSSENSRIRPQSVFQRTWQIITSTDPLVDSDDEMGDEDAREDYIQRLKVISRFSQHHWEDEQASYPSAMETRLV
ncbi:hypothetical protein CPB84DRAFT_1759689 [Gymnopilus junonius]|uniref:Ino eighty subunit 1 n=1 Tax=Gymnopilus junonius TaxID=109634 RepID=A0A9P5P0R1_GYMJU|nr:hypothetical protein CPB84DRAFT_1759689 [Gymnopilus junonius]